VKTISTRPSSRSSETDRLRPVTSPLSTYRLQLHAGFPFTEAQRILPYLKSLGISDCYLSPISRARHGSRNGYDVVSHQEINPELGGAQGFLDFSKEAARNGIRLLVDVVPNHMCIADSANVFWMDVLENGPASAYASYFDVNWSPSKKELNNKVLLPFLEDQYGKVLEEGKIRLLFENNTFWVTYFEWKLPMGPRSWTGILEKVLARMGTQDESHHSQRLELESILNALNYLPGQSETAPDRMKERQREKEILKKRLGQLVDSNPFIVEILQLELDEINGRQGDPRSFDRLEELLDKQAYRLCDWKVAADEINYRRFFDINELAAIRVEETDVFQEVHRAIFDWIEKGAVHGLRVDHVDGLLDPRKYLELLQSENKGPSPLYVVVEKILSREEALDVRWPASGTTGYDFLNQINGLFVDAANAPAIERFYRKFSHQGQSFDDIVVTCKKLIMLVSMASELRTLSLFLDEISEQHRWSRDFTHESLRFALREVISCFPVYRTYIRDADSPVAAADRAVISHAIQEAKRRNSSTTESIFDFIGSVLTLDHPDGLSAEQKLVRFKFVLKFQQFTGPVMAKGVEDTGFYRYFPLLSLNEVGGTPDQFGFNRRSFHHAMVQRQKQWPHSLSASSTHDTKRSEDVRARINVLSEIPSAWGKTVRKWHALNLPHKTTLNKRQIPDKNEEYLLYQTLIGSWPIRDQDRDGYAKRIQDFFLKALRESKTNSSWVKPNTDYEKAALAFAVKILDPQSASSFLADFENFQSTILQAGLFNALSQTLLKIASPGVPDIYQGTEMWDFSLVDPDNRRPVDYSRYQKELGLLQGAAASKPPAEFLGELLQNLNDGRMKLFLVHRALALRNRMSALFRNGSYLPLSPEGDRRRNLIAFARRRGEEAVVVLAGRFFLDFENTSAKGKALAWGNTSVELPPFMEGWAWRNVFTNQMIEGRRQLIMTEDLSLLPFALLERVSSTQPNS